MRSWYWRFLARAILFLCSVVLWGIHDPSTAKQIALPSEVVFITKAIPLGSLELETTIYKPEGAGPFPLVIINHGKAPGSAKLQERYRPGWAARYFLERNYVVFVPMRTGFSKSGGTYRSAGCNVESNGLMQAEDVAVTVSYAHRQSYVDKAVTLVVGQSHGGLTTLAYGASNPDPSVKGLVNFAGGLRQESCSGWEHNLANAVGDYAKNTHLPSLWFYGDNDSYFTPATFHEMFSRYKAVQPASELITYGTFQDDSHKLFGSKEGRAIWEPYLERFLRKIGLPTRVVNPQYRP
jgi:dienelactone hydrolase